MFFPIVTTRPFSERNNLVNKLCRNWANYFSIMRCRVIKLVTKRWRHCVSVVASRKVNFIVLRLRNALYMKLGTRLFIIGTIRGVTSGERFKKNFYCGVYEVISLRKWPSSYDCVFPPLYFRFNFFYLCAAIPFYLMKKNP